ncbi:POTRA domain-containing protein [Anaeromyxobacter dehalogenans]|uniref:Outer membrane protein/protective antigen OMA87-like protein n=1 Tax=Anaeromyxobacter dehalogenans (strain 2CP-C) TaxID=290397 RepID=Q2IQ48_ANADE|nr:POTRA domain-containing protein [Anaeromyxobacter dehalogenans]ABC80929.1 outer membrane protein/protective antigen OMA87-like protein [Anaeromyxobacter dehalogenans 2CP-C]
MLALQGLCLLLAAQLAAGGEPAVVREISVTGNRRTAAAYVRQALELDVGDRFDGDAAALEQRLLNLRLFKGVRVTPRPDGAGGVALEVDVQERWTLLPIPMFTSSGGETGGGLLLVETNLFGWGKQLVAGGTLSTRGATGMAGYWDRAVAGTRWTVDAFALRQDARRERTEGGDVVYAYRDARTDLSAALGRRLTERLAVSAGWFGLWTDAGAEDGWAPPADVGPARGLVAAVAYDGSDFHLFHERGVTARVRYRHAAAALGGGRDLRQAEARATWGGANGLGHAWSIAIAGQGVEGDAAVDALRLGGGPGARGFPVGGLWAERAASTALEYAVPIWRPRWGVATGVALLDAGVARWRGDTTRYVAPGLGLRLHVADVALPALGLDVAWSTTAPGPVASFVVGYRM